MDPFHLLGKKYKRGWKTARKEGRREMSIGKEIACKKRGVQAQRAGQHSLEANHNGRRDKC